MRKLLLLYIILSLNSLLFSQESIPAFIEKRSVQDKLPLKITPLNRRINSDYSEYNGRLLKGNFYFTSLRYDQNADYEGVFDPSWTMQLYHSQYSKGNYTQPKPFDKEINHKNYFIANYTFNNDLTEIYFARCQRKVEPPLLCKLCVSSYKQGAWQKPIELNAQINPSGYTATQPYLVEYDDYKVLYFVSDRPHGFGGMDIWYTIIKQNEIGEPVNAGSVINTVGNEITPYYNTKDKVLYFSSNAHLGQGGYDVFYAKGELSSWSMPVNLGEPINTKHNEYYFTVNEMDKNGYFTSNRPPSRSKMKDTCCYDIFSYQWIEKRHTEKIADTISKDSLVLITQMRNILPISLYFQNDEPDPRAMIETTRLDYQFTWLQYMENKDIYRKEYTKGLTGKQRKEAERAMDDFFEDKVEAGFEKLEKFVDLLVQELKSGKSFTIKVSGYASSLSSEEYNYKLTMRRINSFVNYLKVYQDGVLQPYMNGKTTNSLQVVSEPKGSTEAVAKNISNNRNDKRNSVYGISASLERRIQITEVLVIP